MITVNVYVNEPSHRTEVYAFDVLCFSVQTMERKLGFLTPDEGYIWFEFLNISDLSAAIVQLAGCLNLRDTDVSIIAERML